MARLEVRLGELTAAMLGIMNNQLSRRNILPYVRSDLALKLKPIIAEIARENQGARNDICQKSDRSPIDTKREIAKAAGMLNFFLGVSSLFSVHGRELTHRHFIFSYVFRHKERFFRGFLVRMI